MAKKRQPIKIEETKNYIVEDYKDPPRKQVQRYRSVKLEDGTILTFAVLRKEGPRGGRTKLVNVKYPKREKGD